MSNMLCNSEQDCGPVGCSTAMLCVATGLNDSVDNFPGYIVQSFATPHRLSAIKKRQSNKHQTFVKRKNTKLDPDDLITRSPGLDTPDSLPVNESNRDCIEGNNCDTLKLSKVRRMKSSCKKLEKRRHLMESHFGANNSIQTKASFVQGGNCGLQTARPAVFRSSSTACISPVRKTETLPSPPSYFSSGNRATLSFGFNGRNYSSSNVTTPVKLSDDSVVRCLITSPEGEFLDSDSVPRRRTKSFGSREASIPEMSLAKMAPLHFSSMELHEDLNSCHSNHKLKSKGSLDSSPSSSNSSSCNSSMDLLHQQTSNSRNSEVLTDSINVQPDRVKKTLKAARKKLKGSKSLSKSLHSLFPLGCSGSLTLQHDNGASDYAESAIYQRIDESRPQYQAIGHQLTEYGNCSAENNNNKSPSTPKQVHRSTTMRVLKSYSKRKSLGSSSRQNQQLHKSNPSLPTTSPDCDSVFNNNNNYNTVVSDSKCQSKVRRSKSSDKLKSVNKSPFFSCVATKDLWYNKLAQVIAEEKESTPPSTNIQVSFYDSTTGADIVSIYPSLIFIYNTLGH